MEPQETIKRPQGEANGSSAVDGVGGSNWEPAVKRVKLDDPSSAPGDVAQTTSRPRAKGVAPIKEE